MVIQAGQVRAKYGYQLIAQTNRGWLSESFSNQAMATMCSLWVIDKSTPPLKITRVSTSCGCTKASVEKEELGAYESTTVNVSFDPAVHKDDTDLGDLTRTIYIGTDNPNYQNLESKFTATVVKKQ